MKDANAADLTRTDHPLGWLLTVLQKEHANKEDIRAALMEAVAHIDTLDKEKTQQWQRAIFYLYLLILHRRPSVEHDELKTLVHQHIQETSRREEGEAMAQTMAQYLIQQGETNAKRDAVLKLLRLRFDPVPESINRKVTSIQSLSRLDSLFEKVVTAQTLDNIDWENLEN